MNSMTSVSNAIPVDTNILIYAHDPRDRYKRGQALFVLNSLIARDQAVLGSQCLTEFFNAATRRLPEPLTPEQALAQVERFAASCEVLDLTPAVVLEGCRGSIEHGLSFWDALIWAVAKLNQVRYVLTEDAEHGRLLEGVRFLNPFVSSFDSAILEPEL